MASTDSLRRVAAIFEELAELSAEDKRQALARLREQEPALEAAVRKLFDAEEQLQSFESTLAAEVQQGRLFGPYRAVSLIGQGGMGAVYLAERADGQYTRRAAIKVVHGGMVSPEMRARFLAERQILASLQHSGIAAMLDGGVSDDGDPYLVMEYVDGLPLDVFADSNKLTVRSPPPHHPS
jgi:eukaryotic-like serine/threonine-protein kinase